jgi:hypothetical protein
MTGSLSLRHGMQISATTDTLGDGGGINIQAGNVTLDSGSAIQSASQSTGRAGTISIHSDHDVVLNGNSVISTSAPQSSGGDITVSAGDPVLFPNSEIRLIDSKITASAGPGGGGSITVTAPFLIYLLQGTLDAEAVGNGGNLNIDPSFFIADHGALISRSSTANGGNITISKDFPFVGATRIDATGVVPGKVTVTAPEVDLSGILLGLPSTLLDVGAQLRPDCGVRLTGNVSSFIVVGQGGLPIDPGGFLPSGVIQPQDERR